MMRLFVNAFFPSNEWTYFALRVFILWGSLGKKGSYKGEKSLTLGAHCLQSKRRLAAHHLSQMSPPPLSSSPPSSSSDFDDDTIASAFFVQKKNASVPLRMMLFTNGDGEEGEDKERHQQQQEQQKRFVEIACKGNFCFPEEKGDSTSSSSSSEYYTFGLTDQDGKRYFGFVLRYRRKKKKKKEKKKSEEENNKKAGSEKDAEEEEVAMCVLSSRRFYGLFEEILRAALPCAKALWDEDEDEEEDAESFALESSELGAFLRATLGASVSNGKHSEGGRGGEEDVLVVPSPNAEPSLRLRVPRKEEKEDLACFDAFLYGSSDDDEEDMDDEKHGKNRMKIDSDKDNNINAVSTSNAAEKEEEEARSNDRKYGKRNVVPSDAIVALFVALLFERRIVLTSKSLSKLSRATHAANRMVFPLKWQHVFLPLVPAGLMDYLTAPMPFVVGLPLQLMSAYEKVPKEEVFLLNLDDGSYTYFEEDFELVPKRIANKLQKTLESERELGRREHRRRRRRHLRKLPPLEEPQPRVTLSAATSSAITTTTMEEVISKAFRTFLSSAIGSYPRFVKSVALERPPPEAISNDGLWLDQDAFVEGAPNHRTRLFRVSLRHTQMYEVFVRDRLRACAIVARSGKAQFGSDVKDEDLDEESALAAFGSEFQKEAKHVYRETQRIAKISAIETQRIAKISAIGMRKGAKLVKEKFSTSLDAFKERRQRMKNLSSESLEVANTAEGGDLEWKRIDKTTTMSSIPSSTTTSTTGALASSSEDDEDESDDDDATTTSANNRAIEIKRASERAAKRQQNNNDAIMDETTNNLIDFFDDIVLGASSPPSAPTTSNPAPPAISLLDL